MNKEEFIARFKEYFKNFQFREWEGRWSTRLTFNRDIEDPTGDLIPFDIILCQVTEDRTEVNWYKRDVDEPYWEANRIRFRFEDAIKIFPEILRDTNTLLDAIAHFNYAENIQLLKKCGFEEVPHYPTKFRIDSEDIKIAVQLMDVDVDNDFVLCEMTLRGGDFTEQHCFENVEDALESLNE